MLPDDRDKVATGEQEDVKVLQRYVKDHFPGLEEEPAISEYCLYTLSKNQKRTKHVTNMDLIFFPYDLSMSNWQTCIITFITLLKAIKTMIC